ncbi:glucose dehydrogenase [FAD, quinone] [Condylostylus longicornis]|uniref:glucose dehydrogenase [FAD, quinone] n=1 Tax=Condylostylus longicornis TaxID=2530218 RepID=UPI00244E2C2A|nr:glucose dehydrogenase [FAD, quinone] [Condylostylus longicornis]XP_055377391.1 glucose dehydrogenase [FAD, quinone] [Condylostylus longicornis]XP_055377392.1 glucose dehydrogenase [FAD, quinone] [Condylostylus longicornis]
MSPACECPVSVPSGPTLASTCGGNAFMLFMGLLEVFIRSQCDLEDPCGRASSRFRSEPDYEYDFIVVGGGSGGATAAARLSEVPHWKVLLIEAGGDEPVGAQIPSMFLNFIGSDIDWRYNTEPETNACLNSPEQRCYWPRGKVLGGTSVLNGMMYIRGNREDYDEWEAMGNPGWKYDDVLPFFKMSENNLNIDEVGSKYHATGGPLPVGKFPYNPPMSYAILKAGQELGFNVQDLNGDNATGFMIAQMTSRNGIRYSSARSFLRPARDRSNLQILLNTTVTKVLINPQSKTAHGVEVIDQYGSTRKILVKKEVIISGGAVNSPQILLLSGVGPAEDLQKVGIRPVHNLPGVGKNLQNHVAYFTNFFVDDADTRPLNWATAMEYLLFRDGLMSGTGISDVTAKISSTLADPPNSPDLQFYFGGYLADCAKTGQVGELSTNGSRAVQIFPAVLRPKSRGYITLASNDPLAPPKIFANYLTNSDDVKTLIEGIKIAIRISETAAMKPYGIRLDTTPVPGCENIRFGTDEYWTCAVMRNTGPENHQAGSCKMGPATDPLAVVDHELRVRGIRNLRIMDTSIMPKVTSGNTHGPAVMIADKGVHHVKRAWGALVNPNDNVLSYYNQQPQQQDQYHHQGFHNHQGY